MTVNKVCGSGLKAVVLGAQAIMLGDEDVVVAGGMESMSNAPYILRQARTGYRLGDGTLVDTMIYDGLWDAFNDVHMGNTGEITAERCKVSREEMDEYAFMSHRKAAEATREGRFKDEILPIEIPQRKGAPLVVDTDEGIRSDSSPEGMAKLKPVFKKDGVVTAGNASQISDGAAAMVLMSDERANELGVEPLARITGYATGGIEPELVMLAPTVAVPKLAANTAARSGAAHAGMLRPKITPSAAASGTSPTSGTRSASAPSPTIAASRFTSASAMAAR